MSSKKVKGLRLILGGAPDTPHQVADLPGYYLPSRVTPVGGPGEASEEQAKEAAARDGAVVELVEISEAQAERERDFQAELVVRGRQGVLDMRRRAKGDEIERVRREEAALAAREG